MSEERMMILRMLQEGKINADEAARLLDALGEPSRAASSGPSLGDEVRKAVEDVVHAFPRESIDDARDVIRETVREGVSIARETARVAHEFRHLGRRGGFGWSFHATHAGGHHATAPFEDVRATSASHLIFRNTRGDLRLSRSPDGQLHVRATRKVWAPDPDDAQRLADRLPIEIHDAGDTITVEGPGARPYHERLRVDFDIAVPEGVDVRAHVVRGDITAESLARDIALTLVKGDVRIADCGRAVVEGISSDVVVQGARGETAVKVIRGDVQVTQPAGHVTASTKKGDVSVGVEAAGRLDATSVKGDVRVRAGTFDVGGGADLHTVKGDITLSLGSAARCRIDAAAISGEVASSVPLTDSHRDRRRLSGVFNAPDASVRIRTTRGDISLAPLEGEPAEAATPV
ncbi:MAG: DUF4097 family beta strand repeat-containing protein [Armatimonadota bacterium]